MSDIVDDLLQEVEQLEESTQDLEASMQKNISQTQQVNESNAKASTDANLLALETAKTAQEAAIQSHQAAQSSIKQADSLKSQALELTESNFNWRQAVRNAAKDFKSAKSSFTIMLVTSIVFSLIALGAMGYLLYTMQKQEAQFKGEVLDIITTENTLLNKKITLKIDELASVVEMLTFQVSKQNTALKNTVISVPHDDSNNLETKHLETVVPDKDSVSSGNTHETEHNETPNDKHETPEAGKTVHKKEADHSMAKELSLHEIKPAKEIHDTQSKATEILVQEFSELKNMVEKVLAEQKSLQTKLNPPTPTTGSGLTEKQIKKLNDISWLIRKQAKTLKDIQDRLGVKSGSKVQSNNTVLNELKNLHKQQSLMQQQMLDMQKTIKKYTEAPKEPAPYSYKAK
ncbi:hypothetical protein [Thiomicrorhabdus lithotrophica]|uniref:Uncharacterized protein n=1 Tax=Thiomicrorhabdus lithotrophica TaxID=2949997 RepID=A0ABY8CBT4_9GAMM|nr:hypothetical protein [Thiomicrorhabdus lithotrophica]WEJ63425.1 hypothetical protein NR989_04005 [Thiomicrorhabdus lithotrophica]